MLERVSGFFTICKAHGLVRVGEYHFFVTNTEADSGKVFL
jgi:hypothetical protein